MGVGKQKVRKSKAKFLKNSFKSIFDNWEAALIIVALILLGLAVVVVGSNYITHTKYLQKQVDEWKSNLIKNIDPRSLTLIKGYLPYLPQDENWGVCLTDLSFKQFTFENKIGPVDLKSGGYSSYYIYPSEQPYEYAKWIEVIVFKIDNAELANKYFNSKAGDSTLVVEKDSSRRFVAQRTDEIINYHGNLKFVTIYWEGGLIVDDFFVVTVRVYPLPDGVSEDEVNYYLDAVKYNINYFYGRWMK